MIVIWDSDDNTILIYCWLLVWNMTSTFPETVGNKIIIPIDSYFQRGRCTTNQMWKQPANMAESSAVTGELRLGEMIGVEGGTLQHGNLRRMTYCICM